MNYQKEKQHHISFCGSYCHICDWHTGRIRKVFQAALDALELFGFRKQLEGKVNTDELRLGLSALARSGICPGCKPEADRGPEDRCQIRQCAHSKGIELCSECPEFPCPTLASNPGVVKFGCIENLKDIQANGLEQWVDRQWQDYVRTAT